MKQWQFETSAWLCVAGFFSFPWRFNFIGPFKLCDILFGLAALFLLWSLYASKEKIKPSETERTLAHPIALMMAAIVIGSVLGNLWSAIFFPLWVHALKPVIAEYFRMLITFGFFWLIAYVAVKHKRFVRAALMAAVVSPLLLWLSVVPSLYTYFFSGDERLQGPGGDPSYLGSWIAVALVIAAALFLFRRDLKGRLAGAITIFVFPLLLYTGSRGAVLAWLVGCGIVVGYFLTRRAHKNKLLKVAVFAICLLLGAGLAFAAARPMLRDQLVRRYVTIYLNPALWGKYHSLMDPTTSLSDTGGLDRIQLALRAAELSSRSPLGLGPMYYYWQPVAFIYNGGSLPAHEIFLETALRAGWLGLFCLIYILWLILTRLKAVLDDNWPRIAIFASFCTMIVVSLSTDTLTLRWFWIIAALAAAAAVSTPQLPENS